VSSASRRAAERAVRRIRLGVAGLGRAWTLLLPTLRADPRIELVAAADPREEACRRFAAEFGAKAHGSVEALCADAAVEAVYVATPHQHHAEHACLAASRGKHVLVEKPIALTLEECTRMIEAARVAGVRLVVGPSHSFDAPILQARRLVESGEMGRVRMISALNYTDFLYRPRRPEELRSAEGGGVVYSQAAHQVDIVRLLAGGLASSVRALTGNWDPARPTEGAYAALLRFADDTFASLVYSGYAHFDSDAFLGWSGEMGLRKDPAAYGAARKALSRAADAGAEAAQKSARNYGGSDYRAPADDAPRRHPHFGVVVVSCERADLRPVPEGVWVHGDGEQRLLEVPLPKVPRSEVIDELWEAIAQGRAPLHGGEWSKATLEVCLAILRSMREQREIALEHQVGVPGG
jgi:phthalate 4,5-cis-dihydrodiol dehydrogenase